MPAKKKGMGIKALPKPVRKQVRKAVKSAGGAKAVKKQVRRAVKNTDLNALASDARAKLDDLQTRLNDPAQREQLSAALRARLDQLGQWRPDYGTTRHTPVARRRRR